MPTADEFDLAATKFGQAAEMLRALPTGPRAHFSSDVLIGGKLTADVRETIEELTEVSDHTALLAEDRAETCRFRADECRRCQQLQDEYEAAFARYEEDVRLYNQAMVSGIAPNEPPLAPTPPPTPPPWVELV